MNFFKPLSLVFIMSLTLVMSGCANLSPYKTPISQGTIVDAEAVSLLQNGLTKEQVRQILGPPFGTDIFYPNNWDFVFYTSDKAFYPNLIRHIQLSFDDENYLIDWKILDHAPIEDTFL